MTTKEAVLLTLNEIQNPATHNEVCNHIITREYYDFSNTKSPSSTVSAVLGGFIRDGDTRIKRVSTGKGNYSYYLTKNEDSIDITSKSIDLIKPEAIANKSKISKYHERDLHKLLSSYLKNVNTFSKTIFHEQSLNSKDNNQKWAHPDMVGIKFLTLQKKSSQAFLRLVSRVESFKITSYEIKKEINSDYDLKQSFFQAVSNSSWANFGYLVALEISESLNDEMERLNQSFGIGIIQLKPNPYESKIIFPAKFRELDFKTIDKLCNINNDFEKFIEQTEALLTANDKYSKAIEKELADFCDTYFLTDTEFEQYCKDKNIPA
ncbi:hypothetical protein [Hymenobacter sp. BT190]|uniref:hypothetical protein n=1 Tax=Hymenobacter sp. BT190 TaxID=2763505 RepID=UPI0016519CB6|nr:hypothetical protein [Hymenobacter sp. BT190]MBC6697287.1 hypothetical protein [Hymenobacter sp. BT190]